MKIVRIINNNVISSLNDNNSEIVIMGKGIAFGKKIGDIVDDKKIEKIFVSDDNLNIEAFKSWLVKIPQIELDIVNNIIEFSNTILDNKLHQGIYIALTDHIHTAIERAKKGIYCVNDLLLEIRLYYPIEYKIGIFAIKLIHDKLNLSLTDDEAAFIAMHIISNEYSRLKSKVIDNLSIIEDLIGLIEEQNGKKIKKESQHFLRLIYEIRFILENSLSKHYDILSLYNKIYKNKPKLAKSLDISLLMNEYIFNKLDLMIDKDNFELLAIHINLLTKNNI